MPLIVLMRTVLELLEAVLFVAMKAEAARLDDEREP